jgi:hypothetical protein
MKHGSSGVLDIFEVFSLRAAIDFLIHIKNKEC